MSKCCNTNRMRKMRGLETGASKGGNDPAFGCRASEDALVVPALWLQQVEHSRIKTRSVRDAELIGIRNTTDRNGDLHEQVQDRKRYQSNQPREVASNNRKPQDRQELRATRRRSDARELRITSSSAKCWTSVCAILLASRLTGRCFMANAKGSPNLQALPTSPSLAQTLVIRQNIVQP
jgi:hypothetical protein